jgi:ABC-type antimicrobial peptide transport system permease subunit
MITSFSITLTETFGADMQWQVPWFTILLLVVGTLLFALLATAAPARAASRIEPAVALRIAD